jgi:N-acetylglutamate synthase-like GNAT family acetyltransferase
VRIRAARDDELPLVRELFREYGDSLGIDLAFQDFERELAELPWEYVRILVAQTDNDIVGCVALRPLASGDCEMKRLYVRPAGRGTGAGRALAEAIIAEARTLGYERMLLDTLPSMGAARDLYRKLGFAEVEPYRFNPIAGTSFMALDLTD